MRRRRRGKSGEEVKRVLTSNSILSVYKRLVSAAGTQEVGAELDTIMVEVISTTRINQVQKRDHQ